MRVPDKAFAIAGDWHGSTYWAVDAVNTARDIHEVDTIVHVGDYGFNFEKPFRLKVEAACAEKDVMIYFIDGNHDNLNWILNKKQDEDGLHVISEHVRYIPRGFRWEWWGKTFVGIGGAVSVDKKWRKPNISWWDTETITYKDFNRVIAGGHADVWISHDAPSGIPIPGITPGNSNGWPKDVIEEAEKHRDTMYEMYQVVRPRLLVHGHYHVNYETRFMDSNVIGLAEDATSFRKNLLVVHSVEDLNQFCGAAND